MAAMSVAVTHLPPVQIRFDPSRVGTAIRAVLPWALVLAGLMVVWMWGVDERYWDLDLALLLADDSSMLDATLWISVAPVWAVVTALLLMLLRIALAGYTASRAGYWRGVRPNRTLVHPLHPSGSRGRPPRAHRA